MDRGLRRNVGCDVCLQSKTLTDEPAAEADLNNLADLAVSIGRGAMTHCLMTGCGRAQNGTILCHVLHRLALLVKG